jgi:hypothetical protein
MTANEKGLCEEVVFGKQLFQNPLLLIIDLQVNLALQPLFCKAVVSRSALLV